MCNEPHNNLYKMFDNINILNILSIVQPESELRILRSSHECEKTGCEKEVQDERDLRHLRYFQGDTVPMGEREIDHECRTRLAKLASLHGCEHS